MLTRRASMWTVAGVTSVAAGVVAAVLAAVGHSSGNCPRGHTIDPWWAIAFVALALAPAPIVVLIGRLLHRPGEEITVPTALALCASAILVFACVMVALSGQSCLR